jgi:hypothetical protein
MMPGFRKATDYNHGPDYWMDLAHKELGTWIYGPSELKLFDTDKQFYEQCVLRRRCDCVEQKEGVQRG